MQENMSGSERRMMKRQGEVSAFTRAQASKAIQACGSQEEIERWTGHPSARVRRNAFAAALKLGMKVPASVETPSEPSEFELLVARFAAEGKANPEKSARASMAARKRKTTIAA